MSELSREYQAFINAKKKCVCRLQEQHESDLEHELKRRADTEIRFARQLEAEGKEQIKSARKSRARPKSMAFGGGGGGVGNSSPFNDAYHQPELDLIYKKIQAMNNLRLQQWKYSWLRKTYKLQVCSRD